ncbi:MAG TPA: hypothetical protein VGN83_15845 [Falsiroseomonas sp.]|jgi:hypothetical protein|nr:hypothetical protein [Falsiroseomonas sp.]
MTTAFRRDDMPKQSRAEQARQDMVRRIHNASKSGVAVRADAAPPAPVVGKSKSAADQRDAMIRRKDPNYRPPTSPGPEFRTDAVTPKPGTAAAARQAMINDMVRSR